MSHAQSWLLVTDVDDTLVGDPDGLKALLEALKHSCCTLALNSSRPIASIRRTLDESQAIIEPAAIIGAMGTEIEVCGDRLSAWTATFDGWDRAPVDELMKSLGHQPHDEEYQTPFKASFAVGSSEAQQKVCQRLERLDMPCKVIISGERDMDILPESADKGAASLHLAQVLGVDLDHFIVAGDSRNDLEMFLGAKKGIVVSNARRELRDALGEYDHSFFMANKPRAWGLLEGLEHYKALTVNHS